MTNEELRSILREEIAAAEQRISSTTTGLIAAAEQRISNTTTGLIAAAEQRISSTTTGLIAAAEQRIANTTTGLIAAAEQRISNATIANLSDLRNEFNLRMDNMERRFTDVDRRLDKVSESLRQLEHRMTTIGKWSDSFDTSQAALSQQYMEQQRAIALLAARVAALESKQHGQQ